MVRALASNQFEPGLIHGRNVVRGLSLLLVLILTPKVFLRVLRFSSVHRIRPKASSVPKLCCYYSYNKAHLFTSQSLYRQPQLIFFFFILSHLPVTAICSSPCKNGGRCTSPDSCSCPDGWTSSDCSQGR